jgi:hypothetical protein
MCMEFTAVSMSSWCHKKDWKVFQSWPTDICATYKRHSNPDSKRSAIQLRKGNFKFSLQWVWRWLSAGMMCLHQVLLMKAESTSETVVNFYKITQCNSTEDSHLHERVNSCFYEIQFPMFHSIKLETGRWVTEEYQRSLQNKKADNHKNNFSLCH